MLKNSPRRYIGSLWYFEQKSEYRGDHYGHFKASRTARLFLGALAMFTTISLTVQKRAF